MHASADPVRVDGRNTMSDFHLDVCEINVIILYIDILIVAKSTNNYLKNVIVTLVM